MKVIVYRTSTGKVPFYEWRKKLDKNTKAILRTRLGRIRIGNFGDSKIIRGGGGIWELRIDVGPGYRIYFGKKEQTVVILLIGGSKESQDHDIAKAKQYWLGFQEFEELDDE